MSDVAIFYFQFRCYLHLLSAFSNERKLTFFQGLNLPHLIKEAMQIFVHEEVIVWKEPMNQNPAQLEHLVMIWVSSINFLSLLYDCFLL